MWMSDDCLGFLEKFISKCRSEVKECLFFRTHCANSSSFLKLQSAGTISRKYSWRDITDIEIVTPLLLYIENV